MPYRLIAILEVLDFTACEAFESQATTIMADYGGKIIAAWETRRDAAGGGEEIHLLEFPDIEAYACYRIDARLTALSELRAAAIRSTVVREQCVAKFYPQSPT